MGNKILDSLASEDIETIVVLKNNFTDNVTFTDYGIFKDSECRKSLEAERFNINAIIVNGVKVEWEDFMIFCKKQI